MKRTNASAQLASWIVRSVIAIVALSGGAAASAARPRCELTPSGRQVIEIGTVGMARPVLLYVPHATRSWKALPLILNLHGSGSNGAQQLDRSGLMELADRHHVIVASPDGGLTLPSGGLAWNIPGVPTTAGTLPPANALDDVARILALIDMLIAKGCTDPERVYATGLSGGGRMVSLLGCVLSDRLAAIAPVVGLRAGAPDRSTPSKPDVKTCQPTRPMPVVAFSGGADTTNPIDGGGARYWQYGLLAAERRWADIDGCRGVAETELGRSGRMKRRYLGCKPGADVVSYVTRSGTHQWGVADTRLMWRFMSEHSRPVRSDPAAPTRALGGK